MRVDRSGNLTATTPRDMAHQISTVALPEPAFHRTKGSGTGAGPQVFLQDRSAEFHANRDLHKNHSSEFKGIPLSQGRMGVDGFCV